jgi:hypothetical protein
MRKESPDPLSEAPYQATELVNYPDAPHSFELALPGPETNRILQQGLEFLRAHLM